MEHFVIIVSLLLLIRGQAKPITLRNNGDTWSVPRRHPRSTRLNGSWSRGEPNPHGRFRIYPGFCFNLGHRCLPLPPVSQDNRELPPSLSPASPWVFAGRVARYALSLRGAGVRRFVPCARRELFRRPNRVPVQCSVPEEAPGGTGGEPSDVGADPQAPRLRSSDPSRPSHPGNRRPPLAFARAGQSGPRRPRATIGDKAAVENVKPCPKLKKDKKRSAAIAGLQ